MSYSGVCVCVCVCVCVLGGGGVANFYRCIKCGILCRIEERKIYTRPLPLCNTNEPAIYCMIKAGCLTIIYIYIYIYIYI